MRLDVELVEELLDNPVKIQYMLFPEVDGDRACMEVCLAINRFNYSNIKYYNTKIKVHTHA